MKVKVILLFALLSFTIFSNEVRLKEIARIEGVRSNQLIGMGLVIGLNGTGDSASSLDNSANNLSNK